MSGSVRRAAMLLAIGAAGMATPVGASVASASTSSPAAHRAGAGSSGVRIQLDADGTHRPGSSLTLIAELTPQSAIGTVTLYDGSTKIATGDNYAVRWSYVFSKLTVGTHHFTVDFTPSKASGYSSSHGSATYVVNAEGTLPSPTPTASASPTASSTASGDPQPIGGGIPSHSSSASPTTSASPTGPTTKGGGGSHHHHHHKVTVGGGGGVRHTGGGSGAGSGGGNSGGGSSSGSGGQRAGGGSLPFTGLDARGLITDAIVLIGVGLMLLLVGRRRQVGQSAS